MPDLVKVNPTTGLVMPLGGTQMMTADGAAVDVPADHFVHPQTGRVLPIHGNVAFDTVSTKLICTVDSATGSSGVF